MGVFSWSRYPCRGLPTVEMSQREGVEDVVGDAQRDWYFIAKPTVPAPHLAHPEGRSALRIVLVTVPRVCRSCEHLPDGFDLHLLQVMGLGVLVALVERILAVLPPLPATPERETYLLTTYWSECTLSS